jgi:hypothetical protein
MSDILYIYIFSPLKKYIKTVCCYPERCTLEDYNSIMTDFLDSEKVNAKTYRIVFHSGVTVY